MADDDLRAAGLEARAMDSYHPDDGGSACLLLRRSEQVACDPALTEAAQQQGTICRC
jgi:hypothetical protein